MAADTEYVWDYDAVAVGQTGGETKVTLTEESLRAYARATQQLSWSGAETGGNHADTALPSMVLAYAPLLRYELAEKNGFIALEDAKIARRQTPFAKCEIQWHVPVGRGDCMTSTRQVLRKYERRGSKFVTFRVEAFKQGGVLAADYEYTCIFEYAGGKKTVPDMGNSESVGELARPGRPVAEASQHLTGERAQTGVILPSLRVTEDHQTIVTYNQLRLAGRLMAGNIHTDEKFARANIFGGAVNAGPATVSYVEQMLRLSFPSSAFYSGGRLVVRAIEPFRAGDQVTLGGDVTGAREVENANLVTCAVRGINQNDALVCLADASLSC